MLLKGTAVMMYSQTGECTPGAQRYKDPDLRQGSPSTKNL
jgi:hypothetical protein